MVLTFGIRFLLQRLCEFRGNPDVLALRPLVAAGQQDHQRSPPSNEIHAIAWAIIDSKLRYAFADRPDIAGGHRRKLALRPRLRDDAGNRMEETMAKGLLLVGFDFTNAHEEEFHD